ncbi:MAG: winged helix-turn-helix domain-containing protein [Tannerellaceae bacterium]|jgi:DNA-binding winged helix-turn-helix (wHTH) protein|nr:winged helix-turn-helix domain-containing protein [Tannerellaceae bacterium]
MFTLKKSTRTLNLFVSIANIVILLALESFWLHNAYQSEYKQFLLDVSHSFDLAAQKEQTYRIPINDIINPGHVTIQSCGKEEIQIIRQCPSPDTIIFDNLSGQSLETFIHKAFYELRKNILPLNIYCLADLFAGELQEKNILASFTIDHFNTATGEIIETTTAGMQSPVLPAKYVITANISATTSLQAHIQFTNAAIFKRMIGEIVISTCLVFMAAIGVFLIFCFSCQKEKEIPEIKAPVANDKIFKIGRYRFDSEKNELSDPDQTIYLNKKENAILRTLCEKNGNIVERDFLLNEHWGNTGIIYSRSLDTYITRLRKYVKEDPSVQIITIKSQGYKLSGVIF